MTLAIFFKLLVLIGVVGAGWYAGRTPILRGPEPVKAISAVAFYLLVPALLFRSTARVDLAHLPWATLLGFFAPATALLVMVYAISRWRSASAHQAIHPAAPAVRSIMATFGNTLQVGLPFVAALFGDAGLEVHVAIISLHALTLLTLATLLAEIDLAQSRRDGSAASLWRTVRQTVRNTVIHPVILPVMAGLAWNLLGLPVPEPLDEALKLLASGVVPLCLVMIGLSLALYGVQGYLQGAVLCSVAKMVVLPTLVLGVAWGLLGISGIPLSVLVLVAALPTGSNALLFAQRYETQVPEATATIVVGTAAYAFVAPLWLQILAWLKISV